MAEYLVNVPEMKAYLFLLVWTLPILPEFISPLLLAAPANCNKPDRNVQVRRYNWNSPMTRRPGPKLAEPALQMVAPTDPPPVLAISPAIVTNTFSGRVSLRITGLHPGSTVRIDKMQVNNTDGVIVSDSVLQASYDLVDGFALATEQLTNATVVADITPIDGTILASLNFSDAFIPNMVGEYVFTVSSPTGAFPRVSAKFSVVKQPYGQSLTGRVLSGGTPVPHAYVGLLGHGGGDYSFIGGIVADDNGNYRVEAPPGDYELVAGKPGFVGEWGLTERTVLTAGAHTVVDLLLTRGTANLSGTVYDREVTNHGLAGVQVYGRSEDDSAFAIAYSDANGRWVMPVTPGIWHVQVLPQATEAAGYLGSLEYYWGDTSSKNATGLDLGLRRANALAHGTVRNSVTGQPIPNIAVTYWSLDLSQAGRGVADAQGVYKAPIAAGTWLQTVDLESAYEEGFAGQLSFVVSVDEGGSISQDVLLEPVTASVTGHVVDEVGLAVPGMIISFESMDASSRAFLELESDEDGSFEGGLPPGNFIPKLDLMEQDLDLVEVESAPVTVSASKPTRLNMVLKHPTRRLGVKLTNNHGEPVEYFPLFAEARIGNVLHRTFGWTQEDGVADLGVLDGTWTVRLDLDDPVMSLADNGYLPASNPQAVVNGADVAVSATLTASDGPPTITASLAGTNLHLRWPSWANAFGFQLQQAPSVNGPWTSAKGSLSWIDSDLEQILNISGSAGFFRLAVP